MTLVADSGSTKTVWASVEAGSMVLTEGLNPHFTTDEQFLAALQKVAATLGAPQRIFFYGAGCGSPRQKERVQRLIEAVYEGAEVVVETDMLGACRGAAGHKEAMVAILGTGSNACFYDGTKIIRQAVSTGYILGDEGSGNHIGRLLLNRYLTRDMPEPLRIMFHDSYPLSDEEFLDRVYHSAAPNRFLASLAPFAVRHQEEPYIEELITDTLIDWLNIIAPLCDDYHCPPFYVVGGYAEGIRPLLQRLTATMDFLFVDTVPHPIEGLLRYHA